MISDKLEQLAAANAEIAALEADLATEMKHDLATLPARYGFETVRDFIKAVRAASSGRRGRPPGGKTVTGTKRKRAVITDATRAQVKKLVAADKTGSQIAKKLGISLPSVQNIKKALGLVKPRK